MQYKHTKLSRSLALAFGGGMALAATLPAQAQQVVITGSYAGTFPCPVDQDLSFTYGDLGRFKVRFHAR